VFAAQLTMEGAQSGVARARLGPGVVRCGGRVAVSGEWAKSRQALVHRSQIVGEVAMSRGGGDGGG
jgi:hypothetical protein